MGGIQQIQHGSNRIEGNIHQIQRREAARRRYHPDQIYDPNNPWIRRRSSSSTSPAPPKPRVENVLEVMSMVQEGNQDGEMDDQGTNGTATMTSDRTTSFPEIPENEDEEIALFEVKATTPDFLEDVEERQSTQSWRTYFPLPDEARRGVTQRSRPTRWPNWVTQHDRPTRRPQQVVPKDLVTKWPNWVTQHDRPSRWPEWVSRSDRPEQKKEDTSGRATETVTQWSRTTRGYPKEGPEGKVTDPIERSGNSEASSTESSFQSPDIAWNFVLMKRPGAEPPTFSSSFYKDRDLRLVGEEEEEGFRVAEGQKETRARHNRRIPLKWERAPTQISSNACISFLQISYCMPCFSRSKLVADLVALRSGIPLPW